MNKITPRVAQELICHEAIVQEWYLDSKNVGTWGIGVTDASGHLVQRYKDNPQPIWHCIEVFVWLLNSKYLPDVLTAFSGYNLSETQLGAALSFHYNTGAILRTDWVGMVKSGQSKAAAAFLESHYLNNGDLADRRKAESRLFFSGAWSPTNGTALVIPVKKPSYKPNFSGARRTDISAIVQQILGGQ